MNQIERRPIVEIRASEITHDRTISGTAIVFNRESQLLDGVFKEIILPGAVDDDLLRQSDILMLWNHEDRDIPLARAKQGTGTLTTKITPTGVDFSFKARNTPQGEEILWAVRSGDVDSCSFAFRVADDEWLPLGNGTYLRTIKRFESLHDFSLVNSPAYLDTAVRSLEKYKEEQRANDPEPTPEPTPEPIPEPTPEPEPTPQPETQSDEIDTYYTELEGVVSKFTNL